MEGPIHKRASIAKLGHLHGVQWPGVLIRRVEDKKALSHARQKMGVYEKARLANLDQKISVVGDVELDLAEVKEKFGNMEASASGGDDGNDGSKSGDGEIGGTNLRPELDKNMVTSAKSLREHRFQKPGQRERQASALEKSAELVGDDSQNGGEGLDVDEICN
jgi:hypothetical protein